VNNTSGTIQTGLVNRCAVLFLINESPMGLVLTFADGSQAVLPPFWARAYKMPVPGGPVDWTQQYNLPIASSPLFTVQGEGYEPNEVDMSQLAQGPLNRQSNIGNSIPVSTTVSQVVNDGNPANTVVVEATQSGASGSNVVIENDGSLTIKDGTTTLTNLIQLVALATTAIILGAAGRDTQVAGNLLFNGKLGMSAVGDTLDAASVPTQLNIKSTGGDIVLYQGSTEIGRITNAGNLRIAGGKIGVSSDGDLIDASGAQDTYIKTRTAGGNINFQVPNGNTKVAIGGSGLTFTSGNHIQWSSGDTLGVTHTFTGTGSGTYNHGCPGAPFIVLPVDTQASSTMTVGYDTITATQVHINCGSAHSFKAPCLVG
jgi:hypothetical protein